MNEPARPADGTVGQPAAGGTFDRSPLAKAALLAAAWLFLVMLAVVGRAWQPAANVTPLAAVSLAAGAMFPSTMLAASVPCAALAIGNFFLPPHDSVVMAMVVYAALAWPVALGRLGLLGQPGHDTRWMNVIAGSLASSLVFFFSTNTAYWLLADTYPRTATGLLACLVAALPFHRWMPLGDIAWSLALFGLLAGLTVLADGIAARRLAPARAVKGPGPTSAA